MFLELQSSPDDASPTNSAGGAERKQVLLAGYPSIPKAIAFIQCASSRAFRSGSGVIPPDTRFGVAGSHVAQAGFELSISVSWLLLGSQA